MIVAVTASVVAAIEFPRIRQSPQSFLPEATTPRLRRFRTSFELENCGVYFISTIQH
jgi:hypothetical protein